MGPRTPELEPSRDRRARTASRRIPKVAWATTLAVGLVASACAPAELEPREEAIVGGTIERGYPAVYEMVYQPPSGGSYRCSATLISPHVVLTARHCVWDRPTSTLHEARYTSLLVGWDDRVGITGEYPVSRIEIIPGSTAEHDDNAWDLALLVLDAPAAEAPMDIARERAAGFLVGTNAVVVGWGETPAGTAGTKYRGLAHVVDEYLGLIYADPAICQGDSGGPLFGPDGLIYGVASFGLGPDLSCGVADGVHNGVFRYVAWIDSILASAGDLCVPAPEICDGIDNDCNGTIDDPCLTLGAPCAASDECATRLCEDVGGRLVCTRPCERAAGGLECGPGAYCAVRGCAGRCAVGTLGAAPFGSECASDVDCASGLCRDPGDGRRRCLDPCERDRALCLGGEACVPLEGTRCGGCVDVASIGFPRGLGEPCSAASQCESGHCVVRSGIGECAAPCFAGAECDAGFVCQSGMCVLRRSEPLGGACAETSDCDAALCVTRDGARWCTTACVGTSGCPAGFSCDPTAHVCTPTLALDGAACATSADCLSGLCAASAAGSVCVRTCDATDRCGVGFECRRTADPRTSVCVRPPPPAGGGCAAGRASGSAALTLWVASGALALARRRTCRRAPRA